jgi:DedD protein
VPEVKVQPAAVPEAPAPTVVQDAPPPPPITARASSHGAAPSMPISAAPTVTAPTAPPAANQAKAATQVAAPAPTAQAKPDTSSKLDAGGVPVSWSVQLASLSSRASADTLQKSLRSQGYNAYVRSTEGKNRVFVGPLVDRAEAERLRDVINRQQNLKGFVVRFEPERA